MRTTLPRVLSFVDILGFKDTIRGWLRDPEVATAVESAWKAAVRWVGGRRSLNQPRLKDWRLRVFSDCACISQPDTDLGILNLLEGTAFFQREMITAGFLVRGGISIGRHHETTYSMLSEALLDAHELESTQAKTPRVLLSKRLLNRIDKIDDDDVRQEIKEYVTIDTDDAAFLCYMIFETEDEWCGGHQFYVDQRDLVSRKLEDDGCPRAVREKYEWIARFHNWCVRETAHVLKRSGIMTDDDVWSFPSLRVKGLEDGERFRSALWEDRAFSGHDVQGRNDIDWVKQWPGVRTEDDEPEDSV